MIRTTSLLALALIVAPTFAQAQQVISPRPGQQGRLNLPPHVEEQLWPQRQLSPAEQQLKDHVIVLMDTLGVVRATNARVARQTSAGASAAVIRSVSRALANDCGRAVRTAGPVAEYGASLSTDNARWGDTAIERWRNALADLTSAMTSCEEAAIAQIEGRDGKSLAAIAQRAEAAVVSYQRAESALLNTLQIKIDPRKDRRTR